MPLAGCGPRNRHVNSTVRPWAHNVAERPKAQGEQLPLPFHPGDSATRPSDPDLHRIRQANPHLNDYQFATHVTAQRGGSTAVFHKAYGLVATLDWADDHGHSSTTGDSDAHPGEIGMIQVHPEHQRKGLAEGMYDHATAKGAVLLHSADRSEQGEAFSRRVGGPRLKRMRGRSVESY